MESREQRREAKRAKREAEQRDRKGEHAPAQLNQLIVSGETRLSWCLVCLIDASL